MELVSTIPDSSERTRPTDEADEQLRLIGAVCRRVLENAGLIVAEETGYLARVRRIGQLLEEGLSLPAIKQVLQLETDNARLRRENAALTADMHRNGAPLRSPA